MNRTNMTFWHGGAPNLAVGDLILPRSALPVGSFDREASSAFDPTDEALVYFTAHKRLARGYAIKYANSPTPHAREGWLYRVRPLPDGTTKADPDFPPEAACWSAPRCEIVEIDEKRVPGGIKAAIREIGPYITWSDDSPAYTPDGYMTVSAQWQGYGVTAAELRQFGRWIPIDYIGVNRLTGKIARIPGR